jgi:DNA-nicking Smr family endonuclease
MRRPLKPEELRLWRAVASTARAFPGRQLPPEPAPAAPPAAKGQPQRPPGPAPKPAPPRKPSEALHAIEPNRRRRIALGREPIGASLDLHGLDQDRAYGTLVGFIGRAQLEGHRAVLVITGQGRLGGGILRRRLPEWLAAAPLRAIVAGFSPAQRRHGGDGAFYVALKALRER